MVRGHRLGARLGVALKGNQRETANFGRFPIVETTPHGDVCLANSFAGASQIKPKPVALAATWR